MTPALALVLMSSTMNCRRPWAKGTADRLPSCILRKEKRGRGRGVGGGVERKVIPTHALLVRARARRQA
jgi:hypothetical protein